MGRCRPFSPEIRRDQRRAVRDTLADLADVLEADSEKTRPRQITPADLERVDREYVRDMAHLPLFLDWYMFNGGRPRMNIGELASMPEAMRTDFRYFMRILGEERERARMTRKKAK